MPAGEHGSRTCVPAPADLATLASDLQYSDPPATSLTGKSTGIDLTLPCLDLLMKADEAHAMFISRGGIKSTIGVTNIGQHRSLEDHPSTESHATLVDAESRIPTLVDQLSAEYLLNAPALSWCRPEVIKDAGRSDFN